MTAARKLDPPADPPEARLARLRALPVSEDPYSPEDDAIFEEMEAQVRAGRAGGVTTEEILATLDEMRRDAAE